MLPFRVIQIEQHRALQQNVSRPFLRSSSESVSQLRFSSGHDFSRAVIDPNSERLQPPRDRIHDFNAGGSLLTEPPSDRNFATPNRQIPDLLPGPDFASISSRNTGLRHKNESVFAKWAPTSNRFWVKNRCYRKQTTRPCLTGARTHIKVSLNFTRIAQDFATFESQNTVLPLWKQRRFFQAYRRLLPGSDKNVEKRGNSKKTNDGGISTRGHNHTSPLTRTSQTPARIR